MEKIKIGISGLDEVFKGGVREGSSILITGAPGTGKTVATIQFLHYGAKNNEPGLYITSEETAESVKDYARSLNLDLDEFEKKGLITFVQHPYGETKFGSLEQPLKIIKNKKIKRAVLDSLTLFQLLDSGSDLSFKKAIMDFLYNLKSSNVTFLATSQRTTTDLDSFNFKDEDFLFEGLIILTRIRKSESFERCLNVAKMRGQEHLMNVYPISIGPGGMKVLTKQIPFSLIEKDTGKF